MPDYEDMSKEHIKVPIARLTITYGLNENGEEVIGEQWDHYPDDNATPVPEMMKLGMLGMAFTTRAQIQGD